MSDQRLRGLTSVGAADLVVDGVAYVEQGKLIDAIQEMDLATLDTHGYTPATPAHHNCMIEGGGQRDK
jgi:hypothetical protein